MKNYQRIESHLEQITRVKKFKKFNRLFLIRITFSTSTKTSKINPKLLARTICEVSQTMKPKNKSIRKEFCCRE